MTTDDLYAQALSALQTRQLDVCQRILCQLLDREPLHWPAWDYSS